MKEEVRVYNNGLDIESSCRLLVGNQWQRRIVVCKKPADLCEGLLVVYKNRRDRRMNRQSQSILLQNYVGLEKGTKIHRQTHTLSIITESKVISLAFTYSSNLIQWDAWLRQNLHENMLYYMQLKACTLQSVSPSLINKEVRCHLHDSRLSLVAHLPPHILFYSDLKDIRIYDDIENHTLILSSPQHNGSLVLLCPQIEQFLRLSRLASFNVNALHNFVTKHQCEGAWIPDIPTRGRRRTSSVVSDAFSGIFQYLGLSRKISKSASAHASVQGSQSKPSLFGSASDSPTKKFSVVAASHYANYANVAGTDYNPNYVNCVDISRESSLNSAANVNSTSLPEYVNVNRFVVNKPLAFRAHPIQRQHTLDDSNLPAMEYEHSIRRRSDNSVAGSRYYFPGRNSLRSHPKGRSMVDFSTMQDSSPYATITDRHESWRRAKRFMHAFKQKSSINLAEKDSSTPIEMPKASSTGALQLRAEELGEEGYQSQRISDSLSELDDDEPPPALDLTVNGTPQIDPLREKILFDKPPQGLVKLKEEVSLPMPSPALKRSLFSQIRGSFSKYDGEKATHGYQQSDKSKETDEDKERHPENERKVSKRSDKSRTPRDTSPLDGISTAVNRRQARMQEYDRRASTVSTHKNLITLHGADLQKKSEIALVAGNATNLSPAERPTERSGSVMRRLIVHIRDNSQSHSESTRSSSESLSSDARSKISIRKRNNSPPHFMAPRLMPRQISANTLKQSASSNDSMNSCQTARSITPPLPMKRKEASESSSSEESIKGAAFQTRSSFARRPMKKASSLTKLPEAQRIKSQNSSEWAINSQNSQLPGSKRSSRRQQRKPFSASAGTSQSNLATYI